MSATESTETKLVAALRSAKEDLDRYAVSLPDVEAALKEWDEKPERWEMKVVVLSSEHVSYDAFTGYLAYQAEEGSPDVRNYGDGYMLYTHDLVEDIPDDTPADVRAVLTWALERHYTHVRLDQDGDTTADLPSYDW